MQIIKTPEESRTVKHESGLMFECGDCHEIKPVQPEGGTGYATGPTDKPDALICYACCAIRDRREMTEKGIATLYFSHGATATTGKPAVPYVAKITNWPGTLEFRVLDWRKFRHPFAREAYLGEFIGPDGCTWRFRNIGDSQIAHCRRAAGQKPA